MRAHVDHHAHDPGPPPPPDAPKAAWRSWARARRAALRARLGEAGSAARERALADHLAAWGPWRDARTALVYLAFGSELDPLAGQLVLPSGPRLVTTRTPERGDHLGLHALELERLERHPLGFAQPRRDAPEVEARDVDVALVPGLAFDRRGHRLGYGRGFYDRLLPRLPRRTVLVGVCDDALVVERLPVDDHDVAVEWLLGESGLRPVEPGA